MKDEGWRVLILSMVDCVPAVRPSDPMYVYLDTPLNTTQFDCCSTHTHTIVPYVPYRYNSDPYALTLGHNAGSTRYVIGGLAVIFDKNQIEQCQGRLLAVAPIDGSVLFDKRFTSALPDTNIECYGVAETLDGGYILTCGTGVEPELHPGDSQKSKTWRVLVHRTDSEGEEEWDTDYTTNDALKNNAGEYILSLREGGYAVFVDAQSYGPSGSGGNFAILKLAPDTTALLDRVLEVTPPPTKTAKAGRNTTLAMALHSGEIHGNLTQAAAAFGLVRELNAGGVRIDLFWEDIQPTQDGGWDGPKVAFYAAFFESAAAKGVELTVILSSAPGWAQRLFKSNRTAFLAAWEAYAEVAVGIVGAASRAVVAWQLWNEMNHVPSAWINGDADAVCSVLKIAGAAVARAAGGAPRFVNVMADEPNIKVLGMQSWEKAATAWLAPGCAGAAIDGVGIDHYPGTWTLNPSFTAWAPLDKLLARVNDNSTAGNVWYGKLPAVMETGYSSWAPVVADEQRQLAWVTKSLGVLRAKVVASRALRFPVRYVCYYQLIDVNTGGVLQENHFGVVHSWNGTFGKKKAFGELAAQLALIG